MNKTITIFGSSFPKPGEEEYETALKLGRLLGQNDINVCTGGYQGTMDAVSKGAVESGAQAIGITVNIFNGNPSTYMTKRIETNSLAERIKKLIELGDAYIVLQGGTGTLLELASVWELMNKNLLNEKPVVCHGAMWKNIVMELEQRIKKEKRKTGLINYFVDIQECAEFIISSIKIH